MKKLSALILLLVSSVAAGGYVDYTTKRLDAFCDLYLTQVLIRLSEPGADRGALLNLLRYTRNDTVHCTDRFNDILELLEAE